MERSTVRQPPPCSSSSSSPAGAVSTRQEAREEGDSSRRGREAAPRDRAPLSQQRRLRQATQFLHKDSADLLPLDSLKRLGTSKDLNGSIKGPCPFQSPGVLYGSCLGHQPPEHPLAPSLLGALAFQAPFFHLREAEGIGQEEGNNKEEQPHSVIQRRLVEGNQSRLQGESPLAQARIHGQEGRRKTSKTEIPALLVNCKCRDQELQVAVDTGTQHNQISAGCLNRLGLGKKVLKAPGGGLAPGPLLEVEQLELQLGQETVACSAQVVDVESPELCLGLQTLLSLKCCIDLERGVLRLRAPFPELPFLPLYQEPGQ